MNIVNVKIRNGNNDNFGFNSLPDLSMIHFVKIKHTRRFWYIIHNQ